MVKRGALIEDERMIVTLRAGFHPGPLGRLNRRNCLRAPSARL
jgi:hypothetical protein